MRFLPVLVLPALLLLVPAAAQAAKPPLCTASVIEETLKGSGKLDPELIDVHLIRCGDVTDDGATDVVFTLGSGGTAGDTRFGVIEGGADGAGEVVLLKQGYKVGIARHASDAFDVLQPYYRKTDPNCCPSSFRQTRFTWTGTRFKAGKAKKLQKAPARFYRGA